MIDFSKYGIDVPFGRTHGQFKTKCPQCSNDRRNKRDKSLSVDFSTGMFKCHHCEFKGCAAGNNKYWSEKYEWKMKKVYKKPKWRNNTVLSDRLVKYFEERGISQKTLTEMKICEGMERMPQAEGQERNTVQFPYFRDGELINIKFRTGDKLFKMSYEAELIPYNIDAIKESKECLITEGEIDTLSYIEAGYKFAISVPNGASDNLSYLDEYIESHFDKLDVVYVASDNDDKGLKLQKEIIRRLGADRCKLITFGDGCKDANDHLIKFGKLSLMKTITDATDIKIDGVFQVSDFESDLDLLFENGLEKGFTIGHENFDSLCSFETGRLLVVTGIPGHGKSEFIDEFSERLNIRYGWKFAYFSPENYPLQIHASKIISKFTGTRFQRGYLTHNAYKEVKEYMQENFFFICPKDSYSLDNILDKAAYLVRKKGIKCLVIDPWNRLEHQQPSGMSETNYISRELDKICAFHQKHNILTVLMAHPTKMKKDGTGKFEKPTLYDINGSANFFNKSDFGICVYWNKTIDIVEVHVQKVKFKHLGETGTSFFRYNINNGRYNPAVLIEGEYVNGDWDNSNHLHKQPEQNQIDGLQEHSDWPDPDMFIESKNETPF